MSNTITVVGNLAADPELRFTPSGAAVANFSVGDTPRTFDKAANAWVDGETNWFRCTAWRDLAEHIAESLTKGTEVIITGNLKTRTYDTKDGEKRSVQEIDVLACGPSLRFATAQVTRAQRKSNNGGNTRPAAAAAPAAPAADEGFTDEPPF